MWCTFADGADFIIWSPRHLRSIITAGSPVLDTEGTQQASGIEGTPMRDLHG
jgi:hypothetical protein